MFKIGPLYISSQCEGISRKVRQTSLNCFGLLVVAELLSH